MPGPFVIASAAAETATAAALAEGTSATAVGAGAELASAREVLAAAEVGSGLDAAGGSAQALVEALDIDTGEIGKGVLDHAEAAGARLETELSKVSGKLAPRGTENAADPEHLKRFPCLKPWIGNHYQDAGHKRLLVIGESHFLPPDSTIQHDPDSWYGINQHLLSDKESAWISTKDNITGEWRRSHNIYRNLERDIRSILNEGGVEPDAFAFDHFAYYNYFARPAPETGGSMKGAICPQDIDVSEEIIRWILTKYQPDIVVFASRLAGQYGEKIVQEYGITCISTPHPGSGWWNRTSANYGGSTGSELFRNFLKDQHWLTK